MQSRFKSAHRTLDKMALLFLDEKTAPQAGGRTEARMTSCPLAPLTFSSMIQSKEMKSRSKVTKRQKVRRTSEMALRFSGGGRKCEDRLWLWDSDEPREATAGRLRSRSRASSPGSLLILDGLSGQAGWGSAAGLWVMSADQRELQLS